MISIIHPSRGRPDKSKDTLEKWLTWRDNEDFDSMEWIGSFDADDERLQRYKILYSDFDRNIHYITRNNRSCVDAINNGIKSASGNIIIVVSDDTECFPGWDTALLKAVEGKEDYLLKTKDGIQDYIVTMTVMDRKYYERDGFIYHPSYEHLFADTYLTCLADIRGRLIKSNLEFPHRHYSYSGGKEMPDALHRRNDATWMTGQDTFVRLMKEFTPEERARIKDRSMQGFMKRVGL